MSTSAQDALAHRHTYLNDHLAGALTALEMLDHLIEKATRDDDRAFFTTLRNEIGDDRDTLQGLLGRVGGQPSGLRQVGGWVAEKVGRVKFLFDDPVRGTLERLQALEMLVLGIHGKQLLWRALRDARVTAFNDVDFARLEQRARDQYDRVEARRLLSARVVMGAGS